MKYLSVARTYIRDQYTGSYYYFVVSTFISTQNRNRIKRNATNVLDATHGEICKHNITRCLSDTLVYNNKQYDRFWF